MRILFFLLLMGCVGTIWAQDPYYPDYRKKNDNYAKVREKDIKDQVATFTVAGIVDRIGKEPLKTVIPPVAYGSNYITFQGNDIKVTITAGPFEPAKHKLTYYDEKYLVKIDNKPYFGNYSKVPERTIASVTVIVNKDTIPIPATAYFDLYNPIFTYRDGSGTVRTHNGVYVSPDGHNIYIYMLNQEIKGNYEVTWVIQDKKYLRRIVDTNLVQ